MKINPEEFSKLFHDPVKNSKAIGTTLQTMAEVIAGNVTFKRTHDRQEAIADALLLACMQIGRFDNSTGRAFGVFLQSYAAPNGQVGREAEKN